MFSVTVRDEETNHNFSQNFESENEAIEYAEGCNWLKFNFIVVQDEHENEILRFEN